MYEDWLDEMLSNEDGEEMLLNMLNNLHMLMLKDKPHIKAYKKMRKLHNDVVNSMADYVENGKFEIAVKNDEKLLSKLNRIYDNFDDEERDTQVKYEILIYKNSKKMHCITKEYLDKKKFRKEEKVEMLNSMLNSKVGLYEITNVDGNTGKVYLKDKLTKERLCIVDVACSRNKNSVKMYLYTRIITYNGINFGTGLSLAFKKNSSLINKWIVDNQKTYNQKEDIDRILELYEIYKKDGVDVKRNTIR